MSEVEHRLSWESPSPWTCADLEDRYGRGIWPRLWDETTWVGLDGWHTTTVDFVGDDRIGQYNTLKQWAETHEQPIRNVVLLQRPHRPDDEGWEPVS